MPVGHLGMMASLAHVFDGIGENGYRRSFSARGASTTSSPSGPPKRLT
jgi:hypothetical protein